MSSEFYCFRLVFSQLCCWSHDPAIELTALSVRKRERPFYWSEKERFRVLSTKFFPVLFCMECRLVRLDTGSWATELLSDCNRVYICLGRHSLKNSSSVLQSRIQQWAWAPYCRSVMALLIILAMWPRVQSSFNSRLVVRHKTISSDKKRRRQNIIKYNFYQYNNVVKALQK